MASNNDDDIVITGISGRFPDSNSLYELRDNLNNHVDMTRDDHGKWTHDEKDTPVKMGCMNDLDKCDAQFFGIIRKHCNSLDPVTRQFLERTLEAIADAGVNPADLKGSNTGVYMSVAILEHEMMMMTSDENETYGIMGRNRALNSNRLSYWLDLKGPSYAPDSVFNGGLQCIQEAVMALRRGKVDAALVGSGTSIVYPQSSYQFNQLNLLSADGNTRTFDAQASGYARSEAVFVMFLQRARDAKRSHAQILHVLNQSMNTIPSLIQVPAQENWLRLFEKFYRDCKVDPRSVAYIEADGSANRNADAAEMNAVGEFFCEERTVDDPLLIGCVKSNLGHAEGAANMCGIAKLIISLTQDSIPANLHFKNPNPLIRELLRGKMKVVTVNTPFEGDLVAMNSFSFGQSYGHILLKKNHISKKEIADEAGETIPRILLASSRTEDGIEQVLTTLEAAKYDPEYCHLVNEAFSTQLAGHMYLGYTVVPPQEAPIRDSGHFPGDKRQVWFVFSGMGSQWPTMGRTLLNLPIFKESIEHSAAVLKPFGVDLLHLLTEDDPTLFDNIMHCFVCIVATQIAFVDLLREMGIEPDGIIGHSVGETSASYADGCINHDQTILSAYYRGRASLETTVIKGMMAAVGVGYQQMKNRVPAEIEVACHNGPDSCTLSGPTEQVKEYVKHLTSEGVFARAVNVAGIPYHSRYIQDMGPRMLEYIKTVIPEGKERSPRWVSTSYPEAEWNTTKAKTCDAEYHIHNLLSPVLFEEASKHIPDGSITIEFAPHGLLQAILKRSHKNCVNIGLTNRNVKNQVHVLLKALGAMYMNGVHANVKCLYPPMTYPVSRQTGFTGNLITWDHADTWLVAMERGQLSSNKSKVDKLALDDENCIYKGHCRDGKTSIPQSIYLIKVWEVLAFAENKSLEECPVTITDVIFHKDPIIGDMRSIELEITIQSGTGNFEVLTAIADDQPELLVSGNILLIPEEMNEPELPVNHLETRRIVEKNEFYSELSQAGHDYHEGLHCIEKIAIADKTWKATIQLQNDIASLIEGLLQLNIHKTSISSSKVAKIKKIRKLICNLSDLNNEQEDALFELATDNIICRNFVVKDIIYEFETRKPVKFTNVTLNKPLMTLPMNKNNFSLEYYQYTGNEMEGKQIAYIGRENSKLFMGLGTTNKETAVLSPDKVMKWEIPPQWQLEATVPVPLYYTLAYYAVHVVGQVEANRAFVITEGLNKLGVSSLRVALDVTNEVYTIVSSDYEKTTLKLILPQMASDKIFVSKSKSSEQLALILKKKCPKKVDVIINTGAPDIVQYAIQCLKPFGCFVELSDRLFKTRAKINNSYDYLISASLYSCAETNLCDSHEDIKKQIYKLVKDGISKGVVTPFMDPHLQDWNQVKTVSVKSEINNNRRFQCEPDKAYLILGADNHSWLAIVEWFIQRDAKNIIVVHKDANLTTSQTNKLNAMQERCRLIVKPADTLTPQLIDHIFEVSRAPIALTLLSSFGQNNIPDVEIIQALRQKETFLVALLPTGFADKVQEGGRGSKKDLIILWNRPLSDKTSSFLKAFDRLLTTENNYVVQIDEGKLETNSGDLYEAVFPRTLNEILEYSHGVATEISVKELKTDSPGIKHAQQIPALFVIPGLHRAELVDKMKQIPNPVFMVDFPPNLNASVTDYASFIVTKIRQLARSPYVFLGEGWGGAVALETARKLEELGEETQLFLVAATPEDIANKWTSQEELDLILLTRVFSVSQEELQKETSWMDRLNQCLKSVKNEQVEDVRRSLASIRDKASSLMNLTRTAIQGSVTCISRQNVPRSSISWMSKQEIPFTFVEPTESLLNNEVYTMIQETIITPNIRF